MNKIRMEMVPCPVCGEKKYRILFRSKDCLYGVEGEYQAVECSRCKVWYQNPQPEQESISYLYPDNYGPYTSNGIDKYGNILSVIQENNFSKVNKRTKQDYRIINLAPDQGKDEKLLEVGCAGGYRLFQLQAAGFTSLYATDITDIAKDQFKARRIDFKCGDALEVLKTYEDEYFKTVIMSMTIEHLKNPIAVVKEISRILQKGGEFLLSTVTRDSIDWLFFKKNAAVFDFPRHMIYFDKKQLKSILSEIFCEVELACQVAPIDYYRSMMASKKWSGLLLTCIAYTTTGSHMQEWLAKKGRTTRVSLRCKK